MILLFVSFLIATVLITPDQNHANRPIIHSQVAITEYYHLIVEAVITNYKGIFGSLIADHENVGGFYSASKTYHIFIHYKEKQRGAVMTKWLEYTIWV